MKQLLYITSNGHNINYYIENFREGRNWHKEFDPIDSWNKIAESLGKETNVFGQYEETLVSLVGIFNDGGIYDFEEVEDTKVGEVVRLSRLTSFPTLTGNIPIEHK